MKRIVAVPTRTRGENPYQGGARATSLSTMQRAALLLALMAATVLATMLLVYTTTATPAMAASPIVVDTSPGTAAPPATLGSYAMTPFEADSRPESQLFCDFFSCSWQGLVTGVTAPYGGTLQFDQTMVHAKIGSKWSSWSNGYTGDVYYDSFQSSPNRDQVVMTLPANTKAFYFYVEPNWWDEANPTGYNVTATAHDGATSGPIAVYGNAGAKYFGFYTTDGSTLSTIRVAVDPGAQGFAIGEFGIADSFGPTVVSTVPSSGARGVARGTNVAATFNEDIEPDTLNDSTFTLVKRGSTTPVEAIVTPGADNKSVTLDPSSRLAKRTTYTATIEGGDSGVKDLAGNPLAEDYSWSFKTKRR